MIIEQSTNYAYKLKYMGNPSFDKVRDLSTRFYRELPKELQDELYEALNRGVDILDSEPQMVAYLHAFGQMHQAKLEYAFQKLDQDKFFYYHEINIIDYGCGQALGTMCYANFLSQNNYEQQVKRIILIEPSEICLKRAALHASVFFPYAEIKTINKKFDDLTQDDIVCSEEIPTLHIFSNVLDMLCFELDKFSNLIKSCLKGYNQFVCVGPYFNYSDKDDRVDGFCSIINGNNYYNKKFNKYEFYEDKAWTAQINCFSIGEIEERRLFLDETVTHEDIENGIIDEYGIVYSKDGKRLLACNNYNLETYSIKTGTKMICAFAFGDIETLSRTSLKHIIIPNTVIIIGDGAFKECKSLQNITIPDSVKFIGHSAFKRCSALQKIIIPNSVTSIQSGAFEWCTSLRQVILHNSIKFIGDRAFDPWFLEQIEIPKGTTEKFMKLLDDNYWGKFVELSDSQSSVLIHPQEEIEKHLTEVSEDIINNGIIDDPVSYPWLPIVYSKSGKRLLKCKNPYLETYIIRRGTKLICDYAFKNAGLQNINIPNSVTMIGKESFYGCQSLQTITIPDSVTTIGDNAFGCCESLQLIIIPQGSIDRFKKMLPKELWSKLQEGETQ